MRFKIFIIVISVISVSLLVWYLTQDIQWLIAIITLLVGLGAIFQNYIINNLIWYPELHLSISLKPNDGDCHQIPLPLRVQLPNPKEGVGYYFNLRIKNEGNAAAEDVEVAILEVCKEENDLPKRIDFPPMNILWRHSDVPNGKKIIVKDRIVPLMDTHFTLGRILHPTVYSVVHSMVIRTDVLFELLPIVEINTKTHILEPGTYKIKIALAAKRLPTLIQTYRLWFNGRWNDKPDEMLGQNVSITPIEDATEKEICCITLPLGRYNKVITLCRKYRKKIGPNPAPHTN